MPPAHILLVVVLFPWPTSDSLEDEWARRSKAVHLGANIEAFQRVARSEDDQRSASHPLHLHCLASKRQRSRQPYQHGRGNCAFEKRCQAHVKICSMFSMQEGIL